MWRRIEEGWDRGESVVQKRRTPVGLTTLFWDWEQRHHVFSSLKEVRSSLDF